MLKNLSYKINHTIIFIMWLMIILQNQQYILKVIQNEIAVAATGYVGLSITTLLAQHNKVYAVDIVEEKVNLINHKQSTIQGVYEKN